MRAALVLLVVGGAACGAKESKAPAPERANALDVAKQCTDAVDALAPSYQAIGPKLSAALKMDRAEAQRLLRDSIELLIATRELLCNASAVVLQDVIVKDPSDQELVAARARVTRAGSRLHDARIAYDALLGAASAPTAQPVDEAALLDRMTKALSAQ